MGTFVIAYKCAIENEESNIFISMDSIGDTENDSKIDCFPIQVRVSPLKICV